MSCPEIGGQGGKKRAQLVNVTMPSWDTANKSTELSDYSVCTEAPWLPDYVNELTSFPGSRYDDQVDSTAQTLQYVKHSKMAVISRYLRGIQCLM